MKHKDGRHDRYVNIDSSWNTRSKVFGCILTSENKYCLAISCEGPFVFSAFRSAMFALQLVGQFLNRERERGLWKKN